MLTHYVANSDTLPYLETIEAQAQEITKLREKIDALQKQINTKRGKPKSYKVSSSQIPCVFRP